MLNGMTVIFTRPLCAFGTLYFDLLFFFGPTVVSLIRGGLDEEDSVPSQLLSANAFISSAPHLGSQKNGETNFGIDGSKRRPETLWWRGFCAGYS